MIKKWFIPLFLALLFISATSAFAQEEVTLQVDGNHKGSIPAPVLSGDVLMFPFAEIFQGAGYDVETKTNSAGIEVKVIYTGLAYGAQSGIDHYAIFDEAGQYYYWTTEFTETPIRIGTTSVGVPLDYIRYEIGLDVSWIDQTKTIQVNTANSKPENVHEMIGNHGLYLKINDPRMFVANYEAIMEKQVDPLAGTKPIIKDGSTLLPIAALIEELGGTVSWNGSERKVSMELSGNQVDVWIDKTTALVNGEEKTLSVAPEIMDGRTMVPLRFATESLGLEVVWDGDHQVILLYRPWFKNEMQFDANSYSRWFATIQEETQQNPVIEQPIIPQQPEPAKSTTDPLDSKGKLIHVTDIVTIGMFHGEVLRINGTKILVNWNQKSYLVPDGDEDFWAMVNGISYKGNSWIESSEVSIRSSGY